MSWRDFLDLELGLMLSPREEFGYREGRWGLFQASLVLPADWDPEGHTKFDGEWRIRDRFGFGFWHESAEGLPLAPRLDGS